jgi:MFS family permease
MPSHRSDILKLLPFWTYVLLFKFGAGLHYSLISILGVQIMSPWAVGLAVGGAALLQLVLDVPAGWLLDRLGYVRLLRWSTVAFVLSTAVLFLGLTRLTFGLTLLLSTIGWLFFGPGTSAYVLARAPKESVGQWMGFSSAVASAGIVLATTVLGFVVGWSPRSLGLILTILIVGALVAIIATPSTKPPVQAEEPPRQDSPVRRRRLQGLLVAVRKLHLPGFLLLLQGLTACLFYGAIWFTVPLVMADGTRHGLLGIGLGVFDLAAVVLGTWLGKLADRYDQKWLTFGGLLIFAVAGTLLGFNLNLWFLVLGFVATAGDEMSRVSLWAWLVHLDESHERNGLLNGGIAMFEDLGWTIGPVAAGFLYVAIGPSWTICLAALPIFALWLVASVLMLQHAGHVPGTIRHEPPRRLRHKK